MSRALRLMMPVLLLAIAMHSCMATQPPEPGVVTIHSGGLSVELQRAHAWNIQQISYRGVEIGTRTGSYGALICVPVTGGWIGGAHTVGGVEQVEEIVLTVDGDAVSLEAGAEYSGKRAVLHKSSRLDMVRLDATMIIEEGRITARHTLSTIEDVVVTVTYPFMYCVTSATTQWIAVTTDGETLEGHFANSRELDWHDNWEWTAAFIPEKRTGFLMRHLSLSEAATTMTGYWDHERHHKLYVRWDTEEEPWREGYSLSGKVVVTPFVAPPADWEEVARGKAELVGE